MSDLLALTLPLVERETAFSFAARLAARNGLSASAFALDMGLSFGRLIDGDPGDIAELARLAQVSPDALAAWSPVHADGRRHRFRGETMHAKAVKDSTLRGCMLCLREDAARSSLPPEQTMAIRGDWLFRPVTLCLRHNHPLVPLWTESPKLSRYDSAARLAEIAPCIIKAKLNQMRREPTDYERWLDARLTGAPRALNWLDTFALYPAAHFCELLGRAVLATRIPKWKKLRPEHAWWAFSSGFHVANQGEVAVRNALQELQQVIGEPTDGPKKKFGDLYDRLAFDLTSADYAPFRELLRDHIATT